MLRIELELTILQQLLKLTCYRVVCVLVCGYPLGVLLGDLHCILHSYAQTWKASHGAIITLGFAVHTHQGS